MSIIEKNFEILDTAFQTQMNVQLLFLFAAKESNDNQKYMCLTLNMG